jgi:hypothetical protein
MATKAERRAARERVSAYHESQLAGLLGRVGAEIDRYRAGEIDAHAADETIHHYHRAAAELWKFCFPGRRRSRRVHRRPARSHDHRRGNHRLVGTHRTATIPMIPTVPCSPCGVPRSVTDRGHASRRLSALTSLPIWSATWSPRWPPGVMPNRAICVPLRSWQGLAVGRPLPDSAWAGSTPPPVPFGGPWRSAVRDPVSAARRGPAEIPVSRLAGLSGLGLCNDARLGVSLRLPCRTPS